MLPEVWLQGVTLLMKNECLILERQDVGYMRCILVFSLIDNRKLFILSNKLQYVLNVMHFQNVYGIKVINRS